MRFEILFGWTRQKRKMKRIQRMIWHGDLYEMRCVDGESLYLYLGRRDAFAFWENSSPESKNQKFIWHQIEKADLTDISILDNDRIIRFDFHVLDIYQQKSAYALVFECIPPNPNLILCQIEKDNLRIIDARYQYSLADNPQRQILPGLLYQPPQTSYRTPSPDTVTGMSIGSGDQKLVFDDVNDYLATYYEKVIKHEERIELQTKLIRDWRRLRDKKQRKADAQAQELKDAQQAEKWYQYAEIVKYNLGNIRKGQTALESINYFEPGSPAITIPLDSTLDPVKNMQAFIKKYHKAKKGIDKITQNLAESLAEVASIDQIIQRIEAGEIIHPNVKGSNKSVRQELSMLDKLLRLRIDQDWEIVIGRKASENDFVSTQLGRAHDWWFHTRIYRGGHVLLRNYAKKEPPVWLVKMCCGLAAYYSKARFSQNVPVDYTQLRYVRKPRKSPLGFVTYSNHHTVFADPVDLRTAKTKLTDEKQS